MRFIQARSALVTLMISTTLGCAAVPEHVTAPNGQPMSVEEESGVSKQSYNEEIGRVGTYNNKGERTGSKAIYAKRERYVAWHAWGVYQGSQQIPDDDLYRLANDAAAQREVEEYREKGVSQNRIGWGVTLGGFAVGGVGAGLLASTKEDGDKNIPTYMIAGGTAVAILGMALIGIGIKRTHDEHPLPQARAESAVDRYNASLAMRGAPNGAPMNPAGFAPPPLTTTSAAVAPTSVFVSGKPVLETIQSLPELATFQRLLARSGLASMLQWSGPFTIIGSTNRSFDKLPAKARRGLEEADEGKTRQVMSRFIVTGAYPSRVLTTNGKLPTLDTSYAVPVERRGNDGLKFAGGQVVKEIAATNGVIYVVED